MKWINNLKNAMREDNPPRDEDLYGDYYGNENGYGADMPQDDQNGAVMFDQQEEASSDLPQNTFAQRPAAPAPTLKVVKPSTYGDGPDIADKLMDGSTVVLNLEEMNRENAIRLLDFLLGVAHVLKADMKKVSANTFVFAPGGIEDCDEEAPRD